MEEYKVIDNNYDEEAHFPGGTPVFIESERFEQCFRIKEYLYKKELLSNQENVKFSNEIWICPSGVVLLIGKLHFEKTSNFTIEQFDKIILEHYSELSIVFINIADVLYGSGIINSTNQIFCNKTGNKRITKLLEIKSNFKNLYNFRNEDTCTCTIANLLKSDTESRDLLTSTIDDVYYIDFFESNEEKLININYFSATLKLKSKKFLNYFILINLAFSSFWEFIWFNQYLIERMKDTQLGLFDISKISHQTIAELKLVRLYILQFFNESSPINVRLTRDYMKCIEECWKRFRMFELSDQIKEQLNTLSEMIDWFDETLREIRNYKIGAIGLIFTLLSFLAVASDLSDILLSPVLNTSKLYYVILGGVLGILLTIAIIKFPFHRWYPRLKSC